jgi:hypothetical protein
MFCAGDLSLDPSVNSRVMLGARTTGIWPCMPLGSLWRCFGHLRCSWGQGIGSRLAAAPDGIGMSAMFLSTPDLCMTFTLRDSNYAHPCHVFDACWHPRDVPCPRPGPWWISRQAAGYSYSYSTWPRCISHIAVYVYTYFGAITTPME